MLHLGHSVLAANNMRDVNFYLDKYRGFDALFMATDDYYSDPDEIKKITRLGIPTINFTHDDFPESHFEKIHLKTAESCMYNWTFQPESVKFYKKHNLNYILLPGGANPEIFKPTDQSKTIPVSFIGENKWYRREILQKLSKHVDLKVYGKNWKNLDGLIRYIGEDINDLRNGNGGFLKCLKSWSNRSIDTFLRYRNVFNGFINWEDLSKYFSKTWVSLDFPGYSGSNYKNMSLASKGVKVRAFECCMSGGFYLTEDNFGIRQCFKVGEEIVVFNGLNDLIDKAKYYYENKAENLVIRNAGMIRALKDYTWERLFSQVLDIVFEWS